MASYIADMPSALIFSSYVASSRVGGFGQALALTTFAIEARLIPTVLFGRHPGWGAPGGGAVEPDTFAGVLKGAEDRGASMADLMLTGYFASAEQVRMVAQAIDRARDAQSPPIVLVDPVLGDVQSGLYVKPEVERAVRDLLIPRADILAPNLWELQRITGHSAEDAASAALATRTLGKPALVSSIPCGADQIGVMYVDGSTVWLACHAKAIAAPKGAGDLLTALFAAGLIAELAPHTALLRAVGGVADAVEEAVAADLDDLPIAAMANHFKAPLSRVTLSTLA